MNKIKTVLLTSIFLYSSFSMAQINGEMGETSSIWNAPFSDLDCSDEEVAAYLDQSDFKKPMGFNTLPSYKEFNDPVVAMETIEKGEEAASQGCATIFTEGGFNFDATGLNLDNLVSGIQDMIGGFGGNLSSLANSAADGLDELRESYTEVLQESICERLKPENFQETIYSQIEDVYKKTTSGSILQGTSQSSDVDSFLKKIIENQIKTGNGNLLNLLNIAKGDADFEDVVSNLLGNALSGKLEELEDQIFGN